MAPSLWVSLAMFLTATHAFPAPSPFLKLPRDDKFEWTALGDSYASGVGAGSMDPGSQRCMRFNEAYPRLMNVDGRMPGGADRIFNNVVCSGAQTKDVDAEQFYDEEHTPPVLDQFGRRPPFGKPQIATLSVGGNDIDLKGLIMNCVYLFLPTKTCASQQAHSWELINSPDLVNNIEATIKKTVDKGKSGPAGDNFKLYVTGYGKLFNDQTTQCNDVSFAWWGKSWPSRYYKMTQERRKDFNNMADALNQAVSDAVKRFGNEVTFVPWDGDAEGHRYCEEGVSEPDTNNPDVWFWQNKDRSDSSLTGVEGPFFDALARKVDPEVNDWAGLEAKWGPKDGEDLTDDNFQSPNGVTTDQVWDYMYDITAEKGDFVDSGFWQMLAGIFRVFHPKTPLHDVIKTKIIDAILATPTTTPQAPNHTPMDGRPAQCDGNTFLLPNTWRLSDGAESKTEILYRMRDQACQGLCESIEGVDATYMSGIKDGDSCEYSIKIHQNREMWLTVSESGQNCYEALSRIDGQCPGNSQGGWINGPNEYEFYQFGVRELNAQGAKHALWTNLEHLPYNQMWCGVHTSWLADYYDIKVTNFYDGDWGKSIQRNVHSNCGGVGAANQWKYEADDGTYDFGDGQKSDHWGSFRSPLAQRGCTADTMAVALGLPKGMVSCDE